MVLTCPCYGLHPTDSGPREDLTVRHSGGDNRSTVVQGTGFDDFDARVTNTLTPQHAAAVVANMTFNRCTGVGDFCMDLGCTRSQVERTCGNQEVDAVRSATHFVAVVAVAEYLEDKNTVS
jgi:hypothetical protein